MPKANTLYDETERTAALKRLRAEYGHPLAGDQLTDLIPPASKAGAQADESEDDLSDLIPKAKSHGETWKAFHASAKRNRGMSKSAEAE
jgi:hypothetical protein